MTDLSNFPITKKWLPKNSNLIQLYGLPTPNGVKVSIMLEECGLEYEPHYVNIGNNESWCEEYLSLNPNGKIPAIIDPNGPDGAPFALFESGAILYYLAQKTGKFLPHSESAKFETLQWVFFQMAAIGPMFGQVGFFKIYGGKDFEDKRPLMRYVNEAKRLLGVIENRLSGRDWIMGSEYTIADIAIFPWIRNLINHYQAGDLVGISEFPNICCTLEKFIARDAVIEGYKRPHS
jgi:GSH-dependent disulfide-bond oxidoreductase